MITRATFSPVTQPSESSMLDARETEAHYGPVSLDARNFRSTNRALPLRCHALFGQVPLTRARIEKEANRNEQLSIDSPRVLRGKKSSGMRRKLVRWAVIKLAGEHALPCLQILLTYPWDKIHARSTNRARASFKGEERSFKRNCGNVESAIRELPSFQFRRYFVNYDAWGRRVISPSLTFPWPLLKYQSTATRKPPANLPKHAEWILEIILACKCVWIF